MTTEQQQEQATEILRELSRAREAQASLDAQWTEKQAAFEAEHAGLKRLRDETRDRVDVLTDQARTLGLAIHDENGEKHPVQGLTIVQRQGGWLYSAGAALHKAVEMKLYGALKLDARTFEKYLEAGVLDHALCAFAAERDEAQPFCNIDRDLSKVVEA